MLGVPAVILAPDSTGPASLATLHECPVCGKANPDLAARCSFCGYEASAEHPTLATSALGLAARPTLPGAPAQREPHAGRGVWMEGPESGAEEEPSLPGRRLAFDSLNEELPAPAVADPLIGVIVAERYRIREPLGRGGMGIVYKVEHVRIGKLLAMKLLTGELSRNPEVVRRFKQEALTASKLSSPYTVQVFDFGASEGLTYLVMEVVAGEDLGRTIRATGPMPFARLGKILLQVCASLAEAHQKGIVHRDIKPENVMLMRARDGSDLAKVLDFGLAKLREGPELNDVTSQGAIVGTPYFMAPEQVRGEAVDNRTDIYALGALAYRALTGHYPFSGPTPMSVFTKHLTEPPVPPHERTPELGIPRSVSDLVVRMLAKNPADRFQRVEDLQAALAEEMRAGGAVSVDSLLDPGNARKLAAARAAVAVVVTGPDAAELATRNEVESYERTLRRQRYGAVAFAGVLFAAALGVGAKLYASAPPSFTGLESEPNNGAREANPVPFGRGVVGYLGKRVDAAHSDRDFYAFAVPATDGAAALVRLRVTSLPNLPMCTLLYRQGLSTPLGQYCVGRTARDLEIPALRLDPGRYLVAVMQDVDPYGALTPPLIYENVSDPYTLTLEAAVPDPSAEVEPNDQVASANPIQPGVSLTGALRWARDEDVFCVPPTTAARIVWSARDVIRPAGGVLEVTPMRGPEEGAPVRVHATGNKDKVTASDVMSPWTSAPFAQEGDAPRCLRVRLTTDPWVTDRTALIPNGGSETYGIQVDAAP